MPVISFTSHLRTVGPADPSRYRGQSLKEVLDAVAKDFPRQVYRLQDNGTRPSPPERTMRSEAAGDGRLPQSRRRNEPGGFLPTRRIARTENGGRSFDYFGNGLPQDHAYDLVYRHGLAIDETGEGLAIGSTAGGLWFSGDSAESWTAAKARLPPIYALHFVL
ncbi:MAG: hypothetical protein ACREFW_02655 [Rhizomicrobium sp.]